MAPKFGTSGLRGLVVDLTEDLVGDYIRAFSIACNCKGRIFVGRDLRPSSPQIATFVIQAATDAGLQVVDCGAVPTPALALAAMDASAGAVMVTGSHIPADRNGLKFYVPSGEISKDDEDAITAHLGGSFTAKVSAAVIRGDAITPYLDRYRSAFSQHSLQGIRIGVYQHSAVARDLLVQTFEALGATVLPLARSDTFVPVDTEALDAGSKALLRGWCSEHQLDAIVSTDGDSDRPMVTDHRGEVVAGDILGVLTAQYLGATNICTPISSNSMVKQLTQFERVNLTKIGSPFVIDAMKRTLASDQNAKVVGFEANGGFLLGFTVTTGDGAITPLMTRDSLLPMLAPLVLAQENDQSLAELVETLPTVFTASDRIQDVDPEKSKDLLDQLTNGTAARDAFFSSCGPISNVDTTDGLRVSFQNSYVVHLRPSGNAPELRCYAEAKTREKAKALVDHFIRQLRARLN